MAPFVDEVDEEDEVEQEEEQEVASAVGTARRRRTATAWLDSIPPEGPTGLSP